VSPNVKLSNNSKNRNCKIQKKNRKNQIFFLKNINSFKITFITGWCLQLGLKDPPTRIAWPWPRGGPLVPGCGQPGLKGRGALVPFP
jgi:hypothetical protein